MPWQGKQAQAIFLAKKRELGEAGARRFMHEHGNKSSKTRRREEMIRKFQRKHGGGRGRS